jgi:3-deoxy-D-manno-octulosonate 8-phosphate phosphatase (KDO 8-P phosphatase)
MSKARAKKIKLLLLDVDGVMTDGTIFFVPPAAGGASRPLSSTTGGRNAKAAATDAAPAAGDGDGMVEVKGFNAHDGAGFSLARLGGIQTGIITKRVSETVRLRARDLKIEHVYQGAGDKLIAFREILQKENLKPEQAAYVGDDIIDLPVMRNCGLAFAVANARKEVKDEAHVITDHRGGDGAVRDAVEYILKAQGSLARCVEAYISALTPADDKLQ